MGPCDSLLVSVDLIYQISRKENSRGKKSDSTGQKWLIGYILGA